MSSFEHQVVRAAAEVQADGSMVVAGDLTVSRSQTFLACVRTGPDLEEFDRDGRRAARASTR